MPNKRTSLINISAALTTFAVQMFISFWLSPFVVGRLGEEAYGFINLANNFISYASLIAVAVNSMASRFISIEYNSGRTEEAKKYFSSVFIVNCFLYCLILFISIIFIAKIEKIINIPVKLLFQVKITFFLTFINMGSSLLGTVYTAAAFSTNKMHYSSVIQGISNVIKSILVFLLFTLLPAKIYFLSIATLVAGIVTLLGNFLITKKMFKNFSIKISLFDFSKIIKLLKSGLWVLISNVSNLLLNGLDLLLSNWFISSTIMGRLSLAKQIPFALSSALGVFSNIFSSELTKVYATEGKNRIIDQAKNQLRILTIFFTVPYAGIFAIGLPFLKVWLHDAHYTASVINQIYILMLMVLLDVIVSTYMYSIHSVFISLDKVKYYSVILLIASIISITVTVLLLQFTSLGVYAIACTSTIVLGITHAIIIPMLAASLLGEKPTLFLISELKSWTSLTFIIIIFRCISSNMVIDTWFTFLKSCAILAIVGYTLMLLLFMNKKKLKAFISEFFKLKKK